MRIFLHACAIVLMTSCTGQLLDLGSGNHDLAAGGVAFDMLGSGEEMGPAKFFPDIQAGLDAKTCTTTGACHGSQGDGAIMYVKPMASLQADIDANYAQVMMMGSTGPIVDKDHPEMSMLLTQPLPGSTHTGGAQFTGTSDPAYVKWLAWIQAGAPEQ